MNILAAFYFFTFIFQSSEVPYKPSKEFEVQIDFQFKQREGLNANSIDFTETVDEHNRKKYSGGIRPYLILNVKLLKLSELEYKAKANSNLGRVIFNKKVSPDDLLKIDLGFTDDVKSHVSAHEVEILFFSKEKKEITRIHLLVQENGTFLVNGEMRGKF